MGLSATQVRLLSLTARQHAVEYDAQRIEAQKLQLANESDRVYSDYLEALDATKVQYKMVGDDGAFMYVDATFSKMAEAGFLFNVDGTICKDFTEVNKTLKEKGIIDKELTVSDSYTVLSTLVSEGYVVIMQQLAAPEAGYEYRYYDDSNNVIATFYKDGTEKGKIDPWGSGSFADQSADLKEAIYKVFGNEGLSSSTKFNEVADEAKLKKAEAQYESDMNRINAKDTRFDNELSQLETERNAIKTEIDTLEQVAKDNVERTFKIFS